MDTLVTMNMKTTTRAFAQHFKRRHDNVLMSVDTFMRDNEDAEFNRLNIKAVEYLDNKGEWRKMYELSEEAALILVGRMTGKDAAKVQVKLAHAFTAMKTALKDKRLQADKETKTLLDAAREKVKLYEDALETKANTLAKLLCVAPSKTRPYFELLEGKGFVVSTPKVINGFSYKPTTAGMEYVNHIDKNGIIHWNPEVISVFGSLS